MVAGYFWTTYPAIPQYGHLAASQQHFNQLVAGFRSGQLSLKEVPPAELANLADPYDPAQNEKYRLHDASYYHGRYYIYYGITPALILFWPFVALTGHYLPQKYAVMIFCSAGFLIGAALVQQIRRRCFPKVGTGAFLAMVLAVGAVDGVAFLVRRPEMYEVSVSCAYSMVMAALAALWCSLETVRRPLFWTALSSLFFGLAVGARPTFLFGAASLFVPVLYLMKDSAGCPSRRYYIWKLGLAAFAPLASIGIGLAIYNYLRFGNPLEFGIKYLLMGKEVRGFFAFNWPCIWLNIRLYLFLPTRLMGYFPFVLGVDIPPLAPGYAFTENPFGALTNIPFLLFAGAAPLAWRQLIPADARRLRLFAVAVAWVFLTSIVLLLVYVVASIRYEVDFLPYLAILAIVGILGIEDRFAAQLKWRNLARIGWAGALMVSVAFNFFASCQHLGLLERQDPASFQALSSFFNYPRYACNHFLASVGARTISSQAANGKSNTRSYGPVLLTLKLPPKFTGAREPILAIGDTPQVLVLAFIRRVSKDQLAVGFELPGHRVYECRPISVNQQDPVNVAISCPPLLPDLGDSEWNGRSYLKQLSDLGKYSIAVNGSAALQVNSHLDAPIDRETPSSFGVNPARDSIVTSRFSGEITEVSRMSISESELAR